MTPSIPQVEVGELADLLGAGATLLDVREPAEYAEVRVAGGRLVPLGELIEVFDDLHLPLDVQVYVICRSGGRSGQAVSWLRQQGIDAINVQGGTLAWIEAGLPTVSGLSPS